MRGVELAHVDIYGEILDVTDAAGLQQAWDVVERLWDETVEQARRLYAGRDLAAPQA